MFSGIMLVALSVAGQVGNYTASLPLNGSSIPVVGRDYDGHLDWSAETQDWGGYPPTTADRTPNEPQSTGWYPIRVNGASALVKGYVDGSGRLVWRWSEQASKGRPNPSMISAYDPRANGVDFGGLTHRGVQASDPASKAQAEAIIAQAAGDSERNPLPDVTGIGINWAKWAAYTFLGLTVAVAMFVGLVLVVLLLVRFIRGAKR